MGGDMDSKVQLLNEKVIGNGSFGVVFQVFCFWLDPPGYIPLQDKTAAIEACELV